MESETKTILERKRMFFVFTDKNILVIPKRKYKRIQQSEEKHLPQSETCCVCSKKKCPPSSSSRKRITCIVCKNKATSEDFDHSICKMMKFFLCAACVKDLKERTNKKTIKCPHCQRDETYRDEIVGAVLSLMPHQTLPSLEITPETKVETVARLTRETKVVLSNVAVIDALFFKLMARTSVTIRNKISVVGHDNSFDRCIGKLGWGKDRPTKICFDGESKEEIEQTYENIATMPKDSIQINAGEIKAVGRNICVLLELRACIDGCIQSLSLESSKREYIEEILKTENNSIWVGKVKKLSLTGYAVEIFPKLKFHEENVMEELTLLQHHDEKNTGIEKIKNKSIWVGKVKKVSLSCYAVEILPKLRIHEENVMKKLELCAYSSEDIAGILKMENNSIWVGKVKWLHLKDYAMEILPKLGFHEENEIKLFFMSVGNKCLTEILKTKNNSIWVGKMKTLSLFDNEIKILPKLRIHGENVMESLNLYADKPKHIAEILKMENKSIWVGKVKKVSLHSYALEILPKLGIHKENVMDVFSLNTGKTKHITGILKTKKKSIWIGKVKKLVLRKHAVEILPKLGIHKENVMDVFSLNTGKTEHITGILKTKKKSIWIGKVKKLRLGGDAKTIKDRLDFTLIPRSE